MTMSQQICQKFVIEGHAFQYKLCDIQKQLLYKDYIIMLILNLKKVCSDNIDLSLNQQTQFLRL